ncbi:MAG TPA: hypothetical protein VLM43_16610 [Desulfobacterales bacterium]|nr:hypothetical protein [Desulfobacterales bacterium]
MNSVYSANQAISEDRLEFEKFLADLSAKFVALPPEQLDDEIRNALKRILEFFKIDRCALLRLMPGKTLFQITHNADHNGISPFRIDTPIPVSLFPWIRARVAGRHVRQPAWWAPNGQDCGRFHQFKLQYFRTQP